MSTCAFCGADLGVARSDKRTCSDACRAALSRRRRGQVRDRRRCDCARCEAARWARLPVPHPYGRDRAEAKLW